MIEIANRQKRVRLPRKDAERLARNLLGPRRNLSIAFVDNPEMRRLNRRFLGHDYATDVLAFPADGDLVGEVVISTGVAAREARGRGIPVREELLRYLAHGILHLLGYDDHAARDRKRMWDRQEREVRRVMRRGRRA